MNIIPATHEHLPAILDIFNHEIIHTSYVYLYEPWTMEYISEWFERKQQLGFPLMVAEEEGIVQGYATYDKFREREAYDSTVEYSVYIHKDHRRKGLGKQLLKEMINIAKAKGYHIMIGGLDGENHASKAFHEAMGFVQVAHMKQVARKFDRWLDLVFYQLML